jgi:hypothetical protein
MNKLFLSLQGLVKIGGNYTMLTWFHYLINVIINA